MAREQQRHRPRRAPADRSGRCRLLRRARAAGSTARRRDRCRARGPRGSGDRRPRRAVFTARSSAGGAAAASRSRAGSASVRFVDLRAHAELEPASRPRRHRARTSAPNIVLPAIASVISIISCARSTVLPPRHDAICVRVSSTIVLAVRDEPLRRERRREQLAVPAVRRALGRQQAFAEHRLQELQPGGLRERRRLSTSTSCAMSASVTM